MSEPDVEVLREGDAAGAFTLRVGGTPAGRLDFRREAGILWIDYVVVEPGFRGRGLGVPLVAAAVAWARETGDRVSPLCGYARRVLDAEPAWRDVRWRERAASGRSTRGWSDAPRPDGASAGRR